MNAVATVRPIVSSLDASRCICMYACMYVFYVDGGCDMVHVLSSLIRLE
jgi:hypothetical protein